MICLNGVLVCCNHFTTQKRRAWFVMAHRSSTGLQLPTINAPKKAVTVRTPAKLGLISPNRMWESPALGSASPSLLVYPRQGDVPGYTYNIYVIPESTSAIVILSNDTGLSDATGRIAQGLLPAMYGLQPAVDFVDMVAKGATRYLSHNTKDFKIPLEENQICGTTPPPVNDFVGSYIMDHLDIVCLDISVDTRDASKLTMVVNKQPDQTWEMWHYNYDTWCHLRGIDRTFWPSFLISFRRDSAEKIDGLFWKLDGVDVFSNRI